MADFLAEIFFEFFIEAFVNLTVSAYETILPSKKLSKKTLKIIKTINVIISIAALFLLIFGVVLIMQGNENAIFGKIATASSIAYVLIGLTIALIFKKKK